MLQTTNLSSMDWNQVSGEFEPDSGLRDILIFETTASDWEAVLNYVFGRHPLPEIRTNQNRVEPPIDLNQILNLRRDDPRTSMFVPLGSTTLNCHFFEESTIEFDLDPKEMRRELLGELIEFMAGIGKATNKPVFLTHEAEPVARILKFDPTDDQVNWVGPAYSR